MPNEAAPELWRLILDAGRTDGAIPAGLACRDTLRLEAGMALYGHELSLTTTPYEAGLGRVVKLAKDFVGRDALGELVYIDLPEVGATVTAGESCGEVESTKTVSDLVAPVSGEVTTINDAAVQDPALVGADPYGAGWLYEVTPGAVGQLLTAAEYAAQNGADA